MGETQEDQTEIGKRAERVTVFAGIRSEILDLKFQRPAQLKQLGAGQAKQLGDR
jgi:hypothetical protein